MKVSDYIWDYLYRVTGSKHIFLLSGGGMMHLLDSAGKSKFKLIPMHHEQAASIASNAYGRTINSIGICLVIGLTTIIFGVLVGRLAPLSGSLALGQVKITNIVSFLFCKIGLILYLVQSDSDNNDRKRSIARSSLSGLMIYLWIGLLMLIIL